MRKPFTRAVIDLDSRQGQALAIRLRLLRELNDAGDALELFIQARQNRAERPPVEAQVLEDRVMDYLVARSFACLWQIAPSRNARRMVLKEAAICTDYYIQALA